MASDLERIAQGLLDYLDENPRMAAELRNAAGQCQELAGIVGELASLLPAAAGAALYLDAAANACDEAAHLASQASARGRSWAVATVGGGRATTTDGANRNPATSMGRTAPKSDPQPREFEPQSIEPGPTEGNEDLAVETETDDDEQIAAADITVVAGDGAELRIDDLTVEDIREAEGADRLDEASPVGYDLDTKLDENTTARDVIKRYDPVKANLPPMTAEEAVEYIEANKDDRPWLAPAADCDPEVQRIYATLDTGLGHAHHRHDGLGDDELYERRVAYLEDPAQTDPTKRAKSEDAFKPGQFHFCGAEATRIVSPEVFALAFARAVETASVQAALNAPWRPESAPDRVVISIENLLGPAGHEYCEGFSLNGEWPLSRQQRKVWVKARATGTQVDNLATPTCRRIDSFGGGSVEIRFGPNAGRSGYEVTTMFVFPPAQQQPMENVHA